MKYHFLISGIFLIMIAASGIAFGSRIHLVSDLRLPGLTAAIYPITHSGNPSPTKILPIKFDAQDFNLSCEVATLKMALTHYGLTVDELTLSENMGIDWRMQYRNREGVTHWADPDQVFVGNPDGKQFQDGYGVHWDPILRVARLYRPASLIQNGKIADIARRIDAGQPVIIWGYYGPGDERSWTTWDGERVDAIKFEHTYLAIGYSGPAEAPTGIYMLNPKTGKEYMDSDKFIKMWDYYERHGVVVE